jgi:hypothetical protein
LKSGNFDTQHREEKENRRGREIGLRIKRNTNAINRRSQQKACANELVWQNQLILAASRAETVSLLPAAAWQVIDCAA